MNLIQFRSAFFILIALVVFSQPLQAANLYWDTEGTPPTWSLSNPSWNTSLSGSNSTQGPWVDGSDAIFLKISAGSSITTQTVTVSGAVVVNSISNEDFATTFKGTASDSIRLGSGGLTAGDDRSVTFSSSLPVILTASQTWTVLPTVTSSSKGIEIGGAITTDGHALTLSPSVSGYISFTDNAAGISGGGTVRINGTGEVRPTRAGQFGTGILQLSSGSMLPAIGTAESFELANPLSIDGDFVFDSESFFTAPVKQIAFSGGGNISNNPTISFNATGQGTPHGTQFTSNGFTLNSNVTFDGTGVATILSDIEEDMTPRSITKSGASTVVLGGTNTYTGMTSISGGTLQFVRRTSFYNGALENWSTKAIIESGATAAFNVGGNGEFTATDIQFFSTQTAPGGFKDGSNIGFDTTNASEAFTYDQVIADTNNGNNRRGLLKKGVGTLVLAAANTYSGPTIVTGGTLSLSNSGALGSTSGVNLSVAAFKTDVVELSLQNGVSVPGAIPLNMNATFHHSKLGLSSDGVGSSSWNGPITITGPVVATFRSSADLTINGNIVGSDDPNQQICLEGAGSGIINGRITLRGNIPTTKYDGGTWLINSTGNTWGQTTVADGTLKIGADNALPIAELLQMGVSGSGPPFDTYVPVFDLNGLNQTVSNLSVINGANARTITNSSNTPSIFTVANTGNGVYNGMGVITGNLSLVKSGTATLTLGGSLPNTYAGTTTVNAGKLLINGVNSGGGAYLVASGGTLGGTGTVGSSSVTVNSGGTLAPGASIGSFTVGSATIAGNLAIEYNGNAGTIDLLNVAGSLDISAASISFSNLGTAPLDGQAYVFATYGSLVGNSFASVVGLPAGCHINYNYLNDGKIAIESTPGDFDLDGDVDGADFVAWQTHFPLASGATRAMGDADADGDIDGADFVVWQTQFPHAPNPATVPEPTTFILSLLSILTIGLAGRIRRRAS